MGKVVVELYEYQYGELKIFVKRYNYAESLRQINTADCARALGIGVREFEQRAVTGEFEDWIEGIKSLPILNHYTITYDNYFGSPDFPDWFRWDY